MSELIGPGGWGLPTDSEQDRLYKERKIREQLEDEDPVFSSVHDPKPPHEAVVSRLVDEMDLDGIDDGISLKHLELTVMGFWLKWLRQIIGSCVASGGMRVTCLRTLAEVFVLNEPEEVFGTDLVGTNNLATFAPFSYRAGRSIAGINRGDGSYCGAHIKGMKDYGCVPCSTPGLQSDAFPEPQSSQLYRQYGNSDQILRDFDSVGERFVLKESAEVKDADFAMEQIVIHFKPMMICSMWAFEPQERHPTWKLRNGSPVWIYRRNRRTSWAHNMSIVGAVEVSNKWYTIVDNSWGDTAHKNGSWFVIPMELFDSWLQSAECMTIGDLELVDSEDLVLDSILS